MKTQEKLTEWARVLGRRLYLFDIPETLEGWLERAPTPEERAEFFRLVAERLLLESGGEAFTSPVLALPPKGERESAEAFAVSVTNLETEPVIVGAYLTDKPRTPGAGPIIFDIACGAKSPAGEPCKGSAYHRGLHSWEGEEKP